MLPRTYGWGLGEPKGSTQGDPLTTEGPRVGGTEVKGKKLWMPLGPSEGKDQGGNRFPYVVIPRGESTYCSLVVKHLSNA